MGCDTQGGAGKQLLWKTEWGLWPQMRDNLTWWGTMRSMSLALSLSAHRIGLGRWAQSSLVGWQLREIDLAAISTCTIFCSAKTTAQQGSRGMETDAITEQNRQNNQWKGMTEARLTDTLTMGEVVVEWTSESILGSVIFERWEERLQLLGRVKTRNFPWNSHS